jgi:hypothetical protein
MSQPPERKTGTLPLRQALDASAPLAQLLVRVQASRERLAVVASSLPPDLLPLVQAGPLDDSGWTLLVVNASAAAKLKQLLPRLAEALQSQALGVAAIRVKVQTPR